MCIQNSTSFRSDRMAHETTALASTSVDSENEIHNPASACTEATVIQIVPMTP